VNNNPTVEFQPEKRLRQGDLLTPFLFLIAVEGLLGVVREAKTKGYLRGLKLAGMRLSSVCYRMLMILYFFVKTKLITLLPLRVS